jgi:carbonic anhydrase
MSDLDFLIGKNHDWANKLKQDDPGFFKKLAAQQTPEFLWIGCSDSRVPANQVVDLMPGELFVHRNIANVVIHTDLNCLSVMIYAINVLKVKHIIVCGHYGCGGVAAAMDNKCMGVADAWLRNIRDVYFQNKEKFEGIESERDRVNLLCELNVSTQVDNVAHTTVVQEAWARGQELSIHGWIYGIHDGLVRKLTPVVDSVDKIPEQYRVC